jgi:hypothetical protein
MWRIIEADGWWFLQCLEGGEVIYSAPFLTRAEADEEMRHCAG